MVDEEKGTLRVVAWLEIFPWLTIFRTFRLAIGIRVLLLAAVAVFLTVLSWALLGWVFSSSDSLPRLIPQESRCPWLALANLVPDRPALLAPGLEPGVQTMSPRPGSETPSAAETPWAAAMRSDERMRQAPAETRDPDAGVWGQLSRPFRELFGLKVTLVDSVYLVLCGLTTLAIWAFFGGAITRIVAVRLASDERISLMVSLRYACSKWGAYFAAPLFPLIGVLLAALPIVVLGVLLKFGTGVFVAALLWPLALLGGLLMAILLLGLLFGWPLMWATISVEGTDSFDALSRAYAYVFQRPLHYLFYALVALFLGSLGWLLVSNFAAGVVGTTYWAASWGSNADRLALVILHDENLGTVSSTGAVILLFWVSCVKMLAVAFLSTFFWAASTAVYFLLRRDVDATEMDEVFLEEEDEQTYGLPPMTTDAQGAPVISDEPPLAEGPNDQE